MSSGPFTGNLAASEPEPVLDCSPGADECYDPSLAQKLHITAVFVILLASFFGVMLPTLHRHVPFLRKNGLGFQLLKSFGAGVILATGFIHMIPDAFDALTNPCLGWPSNFPWAGFVACFTALLILLIEGVTGYAAEYNTRRRLAPRHGVHACGHLCQQPPGPDALSRSPHGTDAVRQGLQEADPECPECEYNAERVSVSRGEMHAAPVGKMERMSPCKDSTEEARSLAIAQVLEAGIAFHSVLIGLALGVSPSPCTIRPLLIALCFHQFFEGTALGSCLVKADFGRVAYGAMAFVFVLTTPVGIAIGLGVTHTYNENSKAALGTQGTFDAVSAGILIYMSLVDLIAEDMQSKAFRASWRLQLMAYVSIVAGAGCMAVLAIWA